MKTIATSLFRWALVFLCLSSVAFAAGITANARLSQRTAEVGSQVQLDIEITGAKRSVEKPDFTVDGLDVEFGNQSQSVRSELGNGGFHTTVTVTLSYEIVPQREGEFTIPALDVKVDGQAYRTKPVSLKVQKGTTPPGGAKVGDMRAFAEIELEKKTAYVGQIVPVTVRLFVDGRVRLDDVTNMPDLTGDGFTMQKFPRFQQTREDRDGQTYNVFVFHTVMTPGKAGRLTIGPCEIPFIAQAPRQQTKRQRSVFDSFFDDDFFDPFGAFGPRKRFDAKAEAVEIEVKPLPAEGRPKDFSGAVGQFQMSVDGSPSKVKFGDPVTMRAAISGEGNFDRVKAPELVDPNGWQAFDPTEKFEPGNELNTAGTKRFEIPVVSETAHKQMPVLAFSYFDPGTGKYETLRSKPEPLLIEGAPAATAKTESTPAESHPAAPATPEPSAKKMEDIAGLRYDLGVVRTFAPLYERPWFRIANGALLAGAGVLVMLRLLQRDPQRVRMAAIRRDRDAVLGQLGRDEGFAERAARAVQLEASLGSGMKAASVDAAAAKRVLKLSNEDAAVVERIFDERAAMLYAGEHAESKLAENEKQRIVQTLKRLCRR